MKRKPPYIKKAESVRDSSLSASSKFIGDAKKIFKKKYDRIDEQFSVSDTAKTVFSNTKTTLSQINQHYEISENVALVRNKTNEFVKRLKSSEASQKVTQKKDQAVKVIKQEVIKPVDDFLEEKQIKNRSRKAVNTAISGYGKARTYLKPYYAPETPEELLLSTKNQLLYINACILQINEDEAEVLANRLGKAVTSKVAASATVGSLLGLVSLFGTASNGTTAIATLSGAAANNATLAWVGSLLGGGMAAGAAMTGGLALLVSVGVYKFLSSDARKFEDLTEAERRVVEVSGFLVAAINDLLDEPDMAMSLREASLFLQKTLIPLNDFLVEHAVEIEANLDGKHKIKFREHVLVDFEKQVLDGFEYFINEETVQRRKRYPEFAIAGVIYALLTESVVDDSVESQLALEAIKRIRNDWSEISEQQLSEALSDYSEEQLKGLANNAKGIYHEMLFVENYNQSHDGTYAEMHEATNHAGSDVLIRSKETSEILEEYQLKASSSHQIVKEHFEKYPDIDVLATEEISKSIDSIESSGISNGEITLKMNDTINEIADNALADRVGESLMFTGLVAAGLEVNQVLSGKKALTEANVDILKNAGVSAGSTALVAILFS